MVWVATLDADGWFMVVSNLHPDHRMFWWCCAAQELIQRIHSSANWCLGDQNCADVLRLWIWSLKDPSHIFDCGGAAKEHIPKTSHAEKTMVVDLGFGQWQVVQH